MREQREPDCTEAPAASSVFAGEPEEHNAHEEHDREGSSESEREDEVSQAEHNEQRDLGCRGQEQSPNP